ncbi:YcxB family protein [Terrimonas pollutisoli]|uniref:YcxB family protein n=1 Tax=Terrimonas pollutisoli TaxID=3034147 RepID=UPI0023EB41FA|nr:YcxB family protein [Terrimonas sp. H1YJ31]
MIIAPVFMLIGFPLLQYFASKRDYTSNKRISETIEYQFGKDLLFVKGESFTAQLTWDKIYKVSKTKNWLLIWQNKQVANVIPRRDIWEGDIIELKEILQIHNVTNNL